MDSMGNLDKINLKPYKHRDVSFLVKIKTEADATQVAGLMENGGIKVWMKGRRENNKETNKELVTYVAEQLGVDLFRVGLIRGHNSKVKTLVVKNVDVEELRGKFEGMIS
ncbi:hypothetical protein HOH87_06285 [bacterium]|jgi:uncharacterized protein YggU (UPF0235/DUF167 family)|nr:hypothetical protein [bacterium]